MKAALLSIKMKKAPGPGAKEHNSKIILKLMCLFLTLQKILNIICTIWA
jgi:hypothetical protein